MGDGATIGDVYVDVSPKALDFWAKFQLQTQGQSDKVGAELGAKVGRGIQDKISAGLVDGLQSGARAAVPAAARSGEALGEAMGRAAKGRIEAALKSLPDIKLDADSTKLDKKIVAIRNELKELGKADIADEASQARLTALRTQLAGLVRDVQKLKEEGKDIPVGLDAFEAVGQVTGLKKELEQLRKEAAKPVKVAPIKVPVEVDEPSVSRFEQMFQRRIGGALKNLPKVVVDADSSELDRDLAKVRAELQDLSGKRIGIDLSDAEALAKLAELSARLDALGAKETTPQVKVDLAHASAQLSAFRAEVDRVAGMSPTVKVDVDTAGATAQLSAMESASGSSMTSMSWLVAAGAGLGPAIIPAAAGATAAVGALGAVAFAVGAGIGVLALALVPVIAAVKALSDASDSAGTSGASGASGQLQMAGAIEQVRSARASLANTTANAADSERRAVDQVANAERSLAQAQQASLKAQQAINGAREDARRTLENLSSQVASNALAQRQAALQLIDAQNALDAVKASPLATARQRANAQLTYDQAKQQVFDLGNRQRQLADDQEQAQAKGIDGSAQVVAAEQTVVQAAEQVRKAEQSVADARVAQTAQARQSAFAIAQAQQGVVSAQRAVQAASISAGSAGAASANGIATAFAALSPAGAAFATFLYGLKPIFTDLSKAAQEGLFPGLQAGIQAILPIMPKVTEFVRRLSGVMGTLFQKAGEALASPFWQNFFQQMSDLAIPILEQMGPIVLDVAKGFAGLMLAFAPLAPQIGGFLQNLASHFATFGTSVGSSSGFQKFLDYVRENGPKVVDLILKLAEVGLKLAVAIAPLGQLVLDGLLALFTWLASLTPGQLIGIAGAIGAIAVAIALLAGGPVSLIIVGIGLVVAALVWAYNNFDWLRTIVDTVAAAWWAFAQFMYRFYAAVWTNVLMPAFAWLKKEIPIVGAFFMRLWTEYIGPAFSAIGTAIEFVWKWVIKPALDGMWMIIRDVLAPLFLWLWHHVIEPAWAGISTVFQVAWAAIQIVFGLIQIYIKAYLAPLFLWLWHTILEPAWNGIAAMFTMVWNSTLKPLFKVIGGFVSDHIAPAFKAGIDAIGKAWDGLRELAKKPIAFVVNSVINPLIRGYNELAETFKVGKVKEIPGFATGGLIDGPGGPRDDAILARLSAGEYVIPAHVVAQLGANFFDELIGGGARSKYAGDGSAGIAFPGFADGGLVGFAKDIWGALSDPVKLIKGPAEAAIAKIPGAGAFTTMIGNMGRSLIDGLLSWFGGSGASGPGDLGKAQAFLKAQSGKPYLWASAGPDGFDCSGIVSAVYNVLRGESPYRHTFSTMNQAPFFPKPGFGGPLTAGWSNPGERGPGGDSVGHTAAVLAGVPFESTGGVGVRLGAGITPVSSFAHVGHYDSGGWLPPGLTIARNDTGQPEAILTAEQWRSMQDRRGGNTITIPVHGGDGMNVRELAAAVAGELAWQMR